MEDVINDKKRIRDEDGDVNLLEVKRLREDLLDDLDDNPEICTSTEDLDSFMKSFEEEINATPSAGVGALPDPAASGPGEARTDLGYLLEASDDDLGIPPPPRAESGSSDPGSGIWDNPNCDPFGLGFGFGEADSYNFERGPMDELFDVDFGFGDLSFRPETLPAQ